MATTPLELYEEAYRLQYHENRPAEAIRIYEAIIRDFPDSNECGYSVIQLQKVKASDITKALKRGASSLYPLLIVSFMTSSIALVIALVGVLVLFQQLRLEHQRSTLAVMALSKMYCGQEKSALKMLDELKKISRTDILPIELSSDIFRQHNRAATAVPAAPEADTAAVPAPARAALPGSASAAIAPAPHSRPKSVPGKPRTPKQKKNIFIVNPDSVSYF